MVLPSDIRKLFSSFLDKHKGESTCVMTELVSRKYRYHRQEAQAKSEKRKAERIINVSRNDFVDSGWEAIV